MSKEDAVDFLARLNTNLIDPVDMLNVIWIRAIIDNMTEREFEERVEDAAKDLA